MRCNVNGMDQTTAGLLKIEDFVQKIGVDWFMKNVKDMARLGRGVSKCHRNKNQNKRRLHASHEHDLSSGEMRSIV